MRTNKRVTAIIVRDGKMLLIHRFKNGNDYWVVIGGGVEEGETLEVALEREVLEECGRKLLHFQFLGEKAAVIHDHEEIHYFYLCQIENGELVLGGPEREANNPQNSYELQWLPLEAIADLKSIYPQFDYSKIPSKLAS